MSTSNAIPKNIHKVDAPENNQQSLADAFQAFNHLSEQLAESYQALELRVAGLNEELAATQTQRMQELQEKEKLALRLEGLINALPAAVIVLDGDGIIQEHNQAAKKLFGMSRLGESWNTVSLEIFDANTSTANAIALKNGRWVVISTCPIGTQPGQIILLNDITETRKLQEQLQQQERLITMGETAASLAHQIRTPLASAILYASNLKRMQLPASERVKFANKIFDRLNHLEDVVNDMLLYAKGVTSEQSYISHRDLMIELHSLVESHLNETQTEFEWEDFLEQSTIVSANRQMLISAMINLVVNAIQAMGSNGKIRVKTLLGPQDSLQIQISDTGPGIDNKNSNKIFEPFFTTRKEGTGLGLAVVKAIIQSHKGKIFLEETAGTGTTFSILLPVIKHDVETNYQCTA